MYYIKMTFDKFAGWAGTTKAKVQKAAAGGQLPTRVINGKKYIVRDERAESWARKQQGKTDSEGTKLPFEDQLHKALDRIEELERGCRAYKVRWQEAQKENRELRLKNAELECKCRR